MASRGISSVLALEDPAREATDSDGAMRINPMGLRVLTSPYRSPLSNCFFEQLIGTLRRECLDFLIFPWVDCICYAL